MQARTKLARTAAMVLVPVMALAACAGSDDDTEGADGPGTTDPADPPGNGVEAQPGFETCPEDPYNCNSGERADGGSITWLVVSGVRTWNTYSPEGGTVYGLQVLHGIYPHIGMFGPDRETFEFNMDLLAEEPQLLSEDPYSWQYVIRDEAVWDDGTPITADDFSVSWKLGTSAEAGHCEGCRSRATTNFDQIESVEGSDDGKTVTLTLKPGEVNLEWFTMFGVDDVGGGVMPAHVAAENGFDVDDPAQLGDYFEWLQETMPTFSGGPYRIVEGNLEERVIKEPNENWYGETQPTLDTYIMRIIPDQGAWVPALSNNEIHGGSPIQLIEDILRSLDQMPNVHYHIQPGPAWEHIDFNLDVPELQDVALRRAIFTAIDADNIAARIYGEMYPEYTRRTNHLFAEDHPNHVDLVTETGMGSGDTDAALAILAEAGYEFDGQTLTLDGDQIGPFRLRATSDLVRSTSMELIQADLAQIGVETNIEPTDDLGTMLFEGDYHIAQFGWSGDPAFVGLTSQYYTTGSPSNFGGFTNDDVDRLAQEELTRLDIDEAADIANEIMRIVLDEAYVLPLWDVPVFTFITDDYVNVRDNTATSLRGVYNNHEWGTAVQ
ncbi:ABC transporter family substrate-binding protein [Phytoactinopolyspora limicola]|uniref:ABC transporter family substrate-binding protein n=1 Tax=Phytoactinopolyspora limicola TaxID=2715536 RepID=UPI001A9C6B35|nr:ABC transporter family substrate-binding protein [Phytoactinopolyspora limicola]